MNQSNSKTLPMVYSMKTLITLSFSVTLCWVVSLTMLGQAALAISPPQKSDLNPQTQASTVFTYQGQLRDATGPVNGLFDVRFTLYFTQAGERALQSIEHEAWALTHGLFRLPLNFDSASLETNEGWLEVAVRAHGRNDSYAVLTPRQKLTSTPYAILAQAEPWSLIGVPIGFRGKAAEAGASDGSSSLSLADGEAAAESLTKHHQGLKDQSTPAAPAGVAANQNFIAKFDSRGLPVLDSIMFDNGTNVGIGTMSPNFKLHVNGADEGISIQGMSGGASNLAYMTFRNSAGTRIGYVGDGSTGDNSVFLASDSGDVSLITLGGRVLTATASGNVGIGTTNPDAKLSIAATGDGARVLHLGTERAWVFKQLGTGATTALELTAASPTNNNKNFIINTDGNVGIGTINPGFKLDVAGTIRAANVSPSDARLKNHVTPLTNVLDKLEQIHGVSFEWNDRSELLGHTRGQKDIGVIAQEVEAVFPELVNTSRTDGYKAVDYSRLSAVLIEAVKELKAGNEALKDENEELRTRLEGLEQLVQKLTQTQK